MDVMNLPAPSADRVGRQYVNLQRLGPGHQMEMHRRGQNDSLPAG